VRPDRARVAAKRLLLIRLALFVQHTRPVAALCLDGDLLARRTVRRDELGAGFPAELVDVVEELDLAVEAREQRCDGELVTRTLERLWVAQPLDQPVGRAAGAGVHERRNVPRHGPQVLRPAVGCRLPHPVSGLGGLPSSLRPGVVLVEAAHQEVLVVARGLLGPPRLAERPAEDRKKELMEGLVRRPVGVDGAPERPELPAPELDRGDEVDVDPEVFAQPGEGPLLLRLGPLPRRDDLRIELLGRAQLPDPPSPRLGGAAPILLLAALLVLQPAPTWARVVAAGLLRH
jgi:hypothetical protein